MAESTNIAWTDTTWNPVTGCTKVSPGCTHCYAMHQAKRLKAMGNPRYQKDGDPPRSGPGFGVTMHEDLLESPLGWRKPRRVFVNSMSDLFHREVTDDFLLRVFDTMARADHHQFQVLTKRAHRMAHKIETLDLPLPPHIWLGVSAENQEMADSRVPALLSIIGSSLRWVSAEPLLGPVTLVGYLLDDRSLAPWNAPPVSWVVVGGESGSGRRPMDKDWARGLRDECADSGTAFFLKQGNDFRSGRDRVA